ncbi:hypothetical protein ACIGXA_23380 [Streptomyces fildesensis]|uniref:Uncharacterized protein n=1 Tax=Streptomyces fildesensis TaxID=375757 RepID=A0ABW8CAN1_9ACTN
MNYVVQGILTQLPTALIISAAGLAMRKAKGKGRLRKGRGRNGAADGSDR